MKRVVVVMFVLSCASTGWIASEENQTLMMGHSVAPVTEPASQSPTEDLLTKALPPHSDNAQEGASLKTTTSSMPTESTHEMSPVGHTTAHEAEKSAEPHSAVPHEEHADLVLHEPTKEIAVQKPEASHAHEPSEGHGKDLISSTEDLLKKESTTHTPESAEKTPSAIQSSVQPGKVISGIGFQKEVQEDEEASHDQEINTVDKREGSGNWVYKNYWWRKIEEVYSSIKEAFNQVMTVKMTFFAKRSDTDKTLDRFYQRTGFEQGPFEDIINRALQVMEKEKVDQGFLNKKERAFLEKVQDKQRQLEQLKKDVKAIEELDRKEDEAIEVVLQRIDVCSKYEQIAWTNFKEVAHELSDKEAREQYFETKGLLDDITKEHAYLTGPFNDYFMKIAQAIEDHTQSIIAQLIALKNDGVDLKREADFFEKEDDELEKTKEEKEAAAKKEKEKKEAEHEKPKSFISVVVSSFGTAFNYVKHGISWIITKVSSMFGSTKKHDSSVKETVPQQKKDGVGHVENKDHSSSLHEEAENIAHSVEHVFAKGEEAASSLGHSLEHEGQQIVHAVENAFDAAEHQVEDEKHELETFVDHHDEREKSVHAL